MMSSPHDSPASAGGGHMFHTTHWAMVLSAGDVASPEGQAALGRLCQTYWLPIYAFVRKRGHSPDQAEDLVQEFFGNFLEKNCLAKALPERGRFRSFLMTSVENFLRNVHARNQARKRGGGLQILSLDIPDPEDRYLSEATDESDPAKAFEQRWASTVLATVLERLRGEFAESGRGELCDALCAHLWSDEAEAAAYGEIGARFGLSNANVKTTAYRMRQRYRELLREEIAQTVAHPGEIDAEIRYLMKIVSQ